MATPKLQLQTVEGTYAGAAINARLINKLETANQTVLISTDTLTPPVSPSPGDAYWIPPSGGTGGSEWENRGNLIATWWYGWQYMIPFEGMLAFITDENRFAAYQPDRTWRNVTRLSHFSTQFFTVGSRIHMFYTEKGAAIQQITTGVNHGGGASFDFRLLHLIGANGIDILPNGIETATSTSSQTWPFIADIPAGSWVQLQTLNEVGTVNFGYVEITISEII